MTKLEALVETLSQQMQQMNERLDNEQRLQQRDKQIAAMKERIAELEQRVKSSGEPRPSGAPESTP
jgi:peptidoglycan hydrolase CwlO-like protein